MDNGASIGGSQATPHTSGTTNNLQYQAVFNDIVSLRRPKSKLINEEEVNSEEEEIDLPENLQRVIRTSE